jgi:hypothetical protein
VKFAAELDERPVDTIRQGVVVHEYDRVAGVCLLSMKAHEKPPLSE